MSTINLQNNKRAVIYCRVSTKDQVEEGNSLNTQQKICKDYCLKHNYEIAEIFMEQGESAKTADRTELKKLLIFCANKKNQIQAVVIYKIDRLSRNTDDYSQIRLLLKRYGVEIKSTSEHFENNPVGRFMENTMANIAQFDNDIRTERSVGGMQDAMRDGRYVWKAPLGYNNIKIGGHANIAPDSKLFPLMKEAFELIAKSKYSPEGVRKIMEDRGLVNRMGKPISKSFFYHSLKNKIYTGWIEQFGEKHRGIFEPLVTQEIFEQVQRVLKHKGNRGISHKRDHPDFPLRRFVFNEVGKKLTGAWSQGRRKKYPFYRFAGKNSNYARDDFEKAFMAFMDKFSLSEEHCEKLEKLLERQFLKSAMGMRKKSEHLKQRIDVLNTRKTAIINKNLTGIISDSILKEQLDLIEEELMNVNDSLSIISDRDIDFAGLSSFVKDYLKSPSKIWRKAGIDVQTKLQWFEFPSGITFENNSFRTTEIVNVFKLKSFFWGHNSYKGYFDFELLNNPELQNLEQLDKLRSEIKTLSDILDEKVTDNDSPG